MNGKDILRMRAQIVVAVFTLVAMIVFIATNVDYPQAFAIFTWTINGELFVEGGIKWSGRVIKRRKEGQ